MDFSSLNYPDESFRNTVKYLEFDDMVKAMALELIQRLLQLPEWREDFPIVEPQPLPPVHIPRSVL